jgi:anti-sigma regulatory factor (Ser/Thr protein kinase)
VSGESAEPALLVVTELLSNAVDHGRGPVRVEVTPVNGSVRVEVQDGSPEPPRLQPPDPSRQRGRGVQMVDAVSERWGWTARGDGKVVWADVRTAWPD